MNSKYVSNIYVGSDGKLHKVIGGADTVLPFKGGYQIKEFIVVQNMALSANSTKTYYITTDFPNGILGLQKVFSKKVSDGTINELSFSSSLIHPVSYSK